MRMWALFTNYPDRDNACLYLGYDAFVFTSWMRNLESMRIPHLSFTIR
jgi:hypothetical protein